MNVFIYNKNVVVSNLNTARGKDVSDADRSLQFADDAVSAHKNLKTGHDAVSGIMLKSKLDVGSTVAKLRRAWEKWSKFLRNYTITEEEHRGRPVYSDDGIATSAYLFSSGGGGWATV